MQGQVTFSRDEATRLLNCLDTLEGHLYEELRWASKYGEADLLESTEDQIDMLIEMKTKIESEMTK